MSARPKFTTSLFFATLTLLAACAPVMRPPERPVEPLPPLPSLPVEQITPAPRVEVTPLAPVAARVTLTAVEQDVRILLPALAAAAGLNIIFGPDVRGRVTLHLVDVPADEALLAAIAAAGLTIEDPATLSPWGPTVFRQPALNINTATVEEIRARFGVSTRIAEIIVAARPR
jgi:hypothetical protein